MTKMLDLFEDYRSAANLDELWDKLHLYLADFGVTSIFYGLGGSTRLVEEQGIMSSIWHKTSHPEEYRAVFDHKYYIDDDLGSLHCIYKTNPFIWHDTSQWGDPTERQHKFMLDSFEHDMGVGVSLPVRFNHHGFGGLGLCAAETDEKEFEKMWQCKQEEIMTISHMFDELARDEHKSGIYHLTPREKEVLCWMVAGCKSAREVAEKIGTDTSTVSDQIKSVRGKLGARSNSQAVFKALNFGLISP